MIYRSPEGLLFSFADNRTTLLPQKAQEAREPRSSLVVHENTEDGHVHLILFPPFVSSCDATRHILSLAVCSMGSPVPGRNSKILSVRH
jgi:hypothetical protein